MIESSNKRQTGAGKFESFAGNRNYLPTKQSVSQDYSNSSDMEAEAEAEAGVESESASAINIEDGQQLEGESSQEALKVSQHLTNKLKTLVQMLIAKKKGE